MSFVVPGQMEVSPSRFCQGKGESGRFSSPTCCWLPESKGSGTNQNTAAGSRAAACTSARPALHVTVSFSLSHSSAFCPILSSLPLICPLKLSPSLPSFPFTVPDCLCENSKYPCSNQSQPTCQENQIR